MDKTVSISIGGFSFVLDEIAYNKLKTYLQDVKTSLRGTEGVEDIIEDVEIRISELFRERLKFREVVNEDDINFVIATMGHQINTKLKKMMKMRKRLQIHRTVIRQIINRMEDNKQVRNVCTAIQMIQL
jgi:anthranilate phosphoribosyltransferase